MLGSAGSGYAVRTLQAWKFVQLVNLWALRRTICSRLSVPAMPRLLGLRLLGSRRVVCQARKASTTSLNSGSVRCRAGGGLRSYRPTAAGIFADGSGPPPVRPRSHQRVDQPARARPRHPPQHADPWQPAPHRQNISRHRGPPGFGVHKQRSSRAPTYQYEPFNLPHPDKRRRADSLSSAR